MGTVSGGKTHETSSPGKPHGTGQLSSPCKKAESVMSSLEKATGDPGTVMETVTSQDVATKELASQDIVDIHAGANDLD